MSWFPAVYLWLRDDPTVTSLIESRIYRHGEAPQNVVAPYVTWAVVVGTPENALDENPRIDRFLVQVDCWSENTGSGSRGVVTLATAVRNALEPYGYCTDIGTDERDTETRRWRLSMTWSLWNHRESEIS